MTLGVRRRREGYRDLEERTSRTSDGISVFGADAGPNKMVQSEVWHLFRMDWLCLDVSRFEIGITEKRAKWVADFCQNLVDSGVVKVRRLREGLGRLGFVSGPLEHIRPFLAPMYAWVAAAQLDTNLKIPLMVRLVLFLI